MWLFFHFANHFYFQIRHYTDLGNIFVANDIKGFDHLRVKKVTLFLQANAAK